MALNFEDLKLQLDYAAASKKAQHGDCGSSAASAMSTDMCMAHGAPMGFSRQGSFHSNASSGDNMCIASGGASHESSQCASPACPGQENYVSTDEPLEISLKIHDSAGKAQILKFTFDLRSDSCESVAREMVMDLQLSESAVSRIAAKIEQSLRKEQARRSHSLLLATAASTLAAPQAPMPRVKRTSLDLLSAQHHALADRHMQRMRSLLTKSRGRSSSLDLYASGNNNDAPQEGKVRLCKLRGIYVPDVVKSKNCFSHHFPVMATGFETASNRLLQSSKSFSLSR